MITRAAITALRAVVVTLVVTGIAYPLVILGAAQMLVPSRADGSLVIDREVVVGSELIAQETRHPAYFHPRPSAVGWDGQRSGASNLGPTSAALRDAVMAEARTQRALNPHGPGPVPAELATASASGLDPHLSRAAALWQVPRVAAARRVSEDRVHAIVMAMVEEPQFGIFGAERVNVLLLNLALDRQLGAPGHRR
ncbi:MAG: potassium-transporting ATPase subunit KdpC [Alphaproteobacteria bacterium]|nr:potassium-transporting ATPase subunit KdpC [Alphaproteobacteria bacterium]TAD88387.1 MAG: potassium-transporting ATPase subunit KdpC [Alphaproteobacteria bacterium]